LKKQAEPGVARGATLLIDFDGSVQSACERRVLDHRNPVLGRDLADLQRDVVDASGRQIGAFMSRSLCSAIA
jgi:hypothetical protein